MAQHLFAKADACQFAPWGQLEQKETADVKGERLEGVPARSLEICSWFTQWNIDFNALKTLKPSCRECDSWQKHKIGPEEGHLEEEEETIRLK